MGIGTASQTTAKSGVGIFAKLKLFTMIFFFTIILINTVIISMNAKDINPGVKYLGEKFLYTTNNLRAVSNEVIDNEGVYDNSKGSVHGVIMSLSLVYKLFEAIFLIWLWIWLLKTIYIYLIIGDTSMWKLGMTLSIITFVVVQMMVLILNKENMMLVLYSFRDFFKACGVILKELNIA